MRREERGEEKGERERERKGERFFGDVISARGKEREKKKTEARKKEKRAAASRGQQKHKCFPILFSIQIAFHRGGKEREMKGREIATVRARWVGFSFSIFLRGGTK